VIKEAENHLVAEYIPLSFIKEDDDIQIQIENTIIFNLILARTQQTTTLGELLSKSQYGYTAKASDSGNCKFVRITDLKSGKVNWDSIPFCECASLNKYKLVKNDILIARTGGTTGKSYIVADNPEAAIFASYLIRLTPKQEVLPEYIHAFLNSYYFWNQITEMKRGTAQPNVNAQKMKKLVIPVCPKNLQQDIWGGGNGSSSFVDKVHLAKNKITEYTSDTSLISSELTHQQTLLKKLRQQILQEAIEGKLTADWREQNPNVEPASELLKRIKAEKEQLVKDKKIKKQKTLPPISDEEKPFDLPDSWEFYFLDEITYMTRGSSPRPIAEYITDNDDGVSWIKIGDTKNVVKYIKSTRQKITQEGAKKSQRVEAGDFILSNSMSYGKPYIMGVDGYIHDGWFLIKLLGGVNIDYFYYLLLSKVVQDQFLDLANGAVVKNIRAEIVKKTMLPIPSLAEQEVIVTKIEKVLGVCGELETQITNNQTHAEQLMQAVLKEAFSSHRTKEIN